MRGFEDHYVSVTGILTRYWQAGLQGSPIILLHGIGCSVLDWEQNIASLATRHRVYALDMMGSGLTETLSTLISTGFSPNSSSTIFRKFA